MIVLGVDPGSHRIGYGIIKQNGGATLRASGVLHIEGNGTTNLLEAYEFMSALIKKTRPNIFAIEKLFFFKNQKTFSSVSQARGVLLLAALRHHTAIIELTPLEVKLAIGGYGSADKKTVARMAALLVGKKKLPKPDDISDAVAIALAGAQYSRHPTYPQHKKT